MLVKTLFDQNEPLMNPIRIATAALASLSVVALSGCVLGVYVDGGSGIGTCAGKGDVSIATTQNESGDSFTIDYYGPADVSLAVVQGFYSENNFYDITPTRLTGFGDTAEEGSQGVNVSVIDGMAGGWTFTEAPAGMHASYDGTVAEFMSTLDFSMGTSLTDDPIVDSVLPFAVGVSCDQALTSGVYSETLGIDPVPADEPGVASEFEFAAAQPVFPNHVATGPLQILTQSDVVVDETNLVGTEGTLQLPEGLVGQLGDFTLEPVLDPEVDQPISIEMVTDSAEVPNNNTSDLWFQLVTGSEMGTSYSFDLAAPYSLTDTMNFSLSDPGSGGIDEGEYLVFIALNGQNTANDPVAKLLFGSATYSETDGLTLTSIDVPLSGEVDETAAALSDTGVGADALVLGGFGAVLAVAGVTALAARRRRS